MKEYKSEYDIDVSIDKDVLDKELVNHGNTSMKWAERLADAIEEREIKKAEIEVKRAKLSKEIRTNPKDFDLEKVTESAIGDVITLDKEMQQLNRELIEIVKNLNILTWVKDEMQNKRKRLERLVELYLGQYWSDPKIKKENRNELDVKMRRRKI